MTETQLREEVSRLLDTIDAQKVIIDNMESIENSILHMKRQYSDKIDLFDTLHKQIKELKRINTELRERIMVLSKKSPPFEPESKSNLRY